MIFLKRDPTVRRITCHKGTSRVVPSAQYTSYTPVPSYLTVHLLLQFRDPLFQPRFNFPAMTAREFAFEISERIDDELRRLACRAEKFCPRVEQTRPIDLSKQTAQLLV
ncbi:MAG: hypothetical protein ACM3WP_02120 [Acidobacteriota bacterium]